MKLKLDENLNLRGRAFLEAAGHDVSTVVLQGMQGALDDAVIETCRREERALVTLDMDFANPMDYPPDTYAGIAVLRLPGKAAVDDLLQTIETLANGLKNNSLKGRLWIVEPGRIRVYQQDETE